jgi:hypothetical protein
MYGSYFLILLLSMVIAVHSSHDRVVQQLRRMITTALDDDLNDDTNDTLVEQLSQILRDEEGFRLVNRERRSIPADEFDRTFVDGSGDPLEDEESPHPPFYSNMSIIAFTLVGSCASFICPISFPSINPKFLSLIIHVYGVHSSPSGRILMGVFDKQYAFSSALFRVLFRENSNDDSLSLSLLSLPSDKAFVEENSAQCLFLVCPSSSSS